VYAVGLLKGAFVVVPDMTRRMTVPTVVDFMAASSYGSSTESSGTVKIKKDLDFDPEGKDILIIEDLIDTGAFGCSGTGVGGGGGGE
jgi:hypoxanthine phosphoribosyltransferase